MFVDSSKKCYHYTKKMQHRCSKNSTTVSRNLFNGNTANVAPKTYITPQQLINRARNQKKEGNTTICYHPTLDTVLIVSKCPFVLYFIIIDFYVAPSFFRQQTNLISRTTIHNHLYMLVCAYKNTIKLRRLL